MAQNLLVVRIGALGDTIVCLPILLALKENYNVYFLGRMPGISFLKDHITEAYDIEEPRWIWLFKEEPPKDIRLLPSFDTILIFVNKYQSLLKENFRNAFPSSKIFVYPSLPSIEEGRSHIVRYMFNKVKDSGLTLKWIDVKHLIYNGLKIDRGKEHKVLYHIGSGSGKKNLDFGIWLRIENSVRSLLPSKQHRFLIGPNELEALKQIADITSFDNKRFEFSLNPSDLKATLQDTFLFVGHDSGPTHLAALLGIPTIAIFKESSIKTWRPLGKSVRVLKASESLDVVDAVLKIVNRLFSKA